MSRFLCALCNEEHDEDSNPHYSLPESIVGERRKIMNKVDTYFKEIKRSIDYRMKMLSLEEQVKYLAEINKYAFDLWLCAYIDEYKNKRNDI